MFTDPSRRLEILLQQGRGHRQGFPRIVEAGFVGGIDGELLRGPDVDPRQIADGVIILRVAQPARENRTRIAGIPPRLLFSHRLNPIHDLPSKFPRGLAPGFFRRHFLRLELLQDDLPPAIIFRDSLPGRVRPQVQLSLLLPGAVTVEAVGLQKGMHGCCKVAIQLPVDPIRSHRSRRPCQQQGDHNKCSVPI